MPKDQQVSFRTSARYKSYLERLAAMHDSSVGYFLNDVIRAKTEEAIRSAAWTRTKNAVLEERGLGELEKILMTFNDFQKLETILGEARYSEVMKAVADQFPGVYRALAAEWGFLEADEEIAELRLD